MAKLDLSAWILLIGAATLAIPTLIAVARFSWSTDQGGHGPIVLATGLWLLVRNGSDSLQKVRPGDRRLYIPLYLLGLLAYLAGRITGILEVEGFAMYGVLLVVAYALAGGAVLRANWFPLFYLGFVFPPPDSWVWAVTQPIKIAISKVAVWLLHAVGYPIASSGVSIQIAQYDLLIAAACAGLNSIISLSAICLFYVYVRHNANFRYAGLLLLAIIPVAIFANFIRVIVLILITYHLGDAAAQGFLHDFAGLVMFTVALLTIFGIDMLMNPLLSKRRSAAR